MSCIVVFGREPRPGRVKSRLAAAIGGAAAAEVYRLLLEHAVAEALVTGVRTVLSLAETPRRRWSPPGGVELETQPAGDLGGRMEDAFRRRFADGHDRVVLIGSDCPALSSSVLRRALSELDRTRVVIGPAADGGYWLVGQRPPGAALFEGVPWSSPDTLAATRDRLGQLALDAVELEQLPDLDTVADLEAAVRDPRVPGALRRALAGLSRAGGPPATR